MTSQPAPATSVTYRGLTHECVDPHCHVPTFVATLQDHPDDSTEVHGLAVVENPE